MLYYKDTDGNLHCLDSEQFDYLLPAGCVPISQAEAKAIEHPPLSDAELREKAKTEFTSLIQKHLDAFAQTRGYDGILSACSYATSDVTRFNTEGQRCVYLRDQTWLAAYMLMDEVEQGGRSMPTSDEVLSALPTLTWGDE